MTGLRQLGVPAERKSADPVVVLDRLDELAEGPAADALLDALDPDRNHVFRDHYVGLPIDLSAVTWLATAADPERVPATLRDRLDVISLPGYCQAEKLRIAAEHVIPRQWARHGLTPERLSFSPAAIRRLIRGYTREAGVKHLDRLVGAFARRVARLGREDGRWPGEVGPEALGAGIAEPPFREGEFADRTRPVSLGVSPEGGRLGVVEARCLAGRGWVREHAHRLDALALAFDWTDIHVHLPAGGRRQDGPSAGVTIVTAVVSVLTGQAVRPGVAMTGEITLSGDVLPVGSVEEKLLAAGRCGMAAVVVPKANQGDVMSVGDELRREVAVHYAATIDDVLNVALPGERTASAACLRPALGRLAVRGLEVDELPAVVLEARRFEQPAIGRADVGPDPAVRPDASLGRLLEDQLSHDLGVGVGVLFHVLKIATPHPTELECGVFPNPAEPPTAAVFLLPSFGLVE